MRRFPALVLTLASVVAGLFAEDNPKAAPHPPKDQSAVAKYWKQIAAHHALNAQLQESLSARQKQLMEQIAAVDQERAADAKSLCDKDERLDESGNDPVCVPEVHASANDKAPAK